MRKEELPVPLWPLWDQLQLELIRIRQEADLLRRWRARLQFSTWVLLGAAALNLGVLAWNLAR